MTVERLVRAAGVFLLALLIGFAGITGGDSRRAEAFVPPIPIAPVGLVASPALATGAVVLGVAGLAFGGYEVWTHRAAIINWADHTFGLGTGSEGAAGTKSAGSTPVQDYWGDQFGYPYDLPPSFDLGAMGMSCPTGLGPGGTLDGGGQTCTGSWFGQGCTGQPLCAGPPEADVAVMATCRSPYDGSVFGTDPTGVTRLTGTTGYSFTVASPCPSGMGTVSLFVYNPMDSNTISRCTAHCYGYVYWVAGSAATTHTATATVTCRSIPGPNGGNGDSDQVYIDLGQYTSDNPNYTPGVSIPACDDDLGSSHVERVQVFCGIAGSVVQMLCIDWTPLVGLAEPDNQYAQCLYFSGDTPCELRVEFLQGSTWVPCDVGLPECTDWETSAAAQPSGYRCVWGPYTLATSSCDPLRDRYATAPSTSPSTSASTGPSTSPSTGPSTSPSLSPSVSPTTGGFPTTGTNPDPSDPTAPGGDPNDTKGGNCMGSAWSWNPVNWIYIPVKCALITVFLPSADALTEVQTSLDGLKSKAPIGYIAGMPAWISPLASGGGSACPDWKVGVASHEFSVVCGQPFIERIHSARPLLTAGMVAMAFSGFIWSVWYAGIPWLRLSKEWR